MDMVYSYPDVLSYTSLRHPTYTSGSDYEWRSEEHKQDKRAKKGQNKSADCKGSKSKDSCPICQERQRRPLAKYIQQKSREERTKDASIVEEEETEQQETKEFAAKAGTSQ